MVTVNQTVLGRTRGDYRSDNSRLKSVGRAAAALLDFYSYNDEGRRVFNLEPLGGMGSSFSIESLDLMLQWRNLYESLVAAGLVELDHVGLPFSAGLAVFLRVQSKLPTATNWVNRSQFEVLTGAGSYAMADTSALVVFYDENRLHDVRVVRDVMPEAMRGQYLQSILEGVTSTAIGLIPALTTPATPNGWFAIADDSGVPDGEQDGSQYWPARLVIERLTTTIVDGGVDDDSSTARYRIMWQGKVAHGYGTSDIGSIFVCNVLMTKDVGSVLNNVTKSQAKAIFAQVCSGFNSGVERFVLVRMTDYRAIQWFYDNVLQPEIVGGQVVGDCYVTLNLPSEDIGFIDFKARVNDYYIDLLPQVFSGYKSDGMQWVIKSDAPDIVKISRAYYQVRDSTNDLGLSNDYGRYPVSSAANGYFYRTVAEAQNVIDARQVPASFSVVYRETHFYPVPDFVTPDNLSGAGTGAGTLGEGGVPPPPPLPPPPPVGSTGNFAMVKLSRLIDSTGQFVRLVYPIEQIFYDVSDASAVSQFESSDEVDYVYYLVRLADFAVVRIANKGVYSSGAAVGSFGCVVGHYFSGKKYVEFNSGSVDVALVSHFQHVEDYSVTENWDVEPLSGVASQITTSIGVGAATLDAIGVVL